MYVCTMCVPGTQGGQKRVSDILSGAELQIGVSHHVEPNPGLV